MIRPGFGGWPATGGFWRGKPDSNRRPQTWKARALPTELLPRTSGLPAGRVSFFTARIYSSLKIFKNWYGVDVWAGPGELLEAAGVPAQPIQPRGEV